ncbi:hypothetical protein LO772_15055 [Yinghuangia sp. ASG 101]|uniref:hypothetical protein n=1 Tax=Yinghuangia sp. ASG 101 TaxID=2896848 RepID=UPI001E62EC0F|nr:hypothetical protein [Yinghuangia sp. ASG 101]UGQ14771.1 hypothetical protein LO772_15055 [Yinghuangia sp. ASG 101]
MRINGAAHTRPSARRDLAAHRAEVRRNPPTRDAAPDGDRTVAGFDRGYGTYAEQIVVAAADVAVVPDDLDLTATAAGKVVRPRQQFHDDRPAGDRPAQRAGRRAGVAGLLARAAGELPARVHAFVPVDQAADAHRATAEGGLRGRYVIRP